MEIIECTVKRIVYFNDSNGYSVLSVRGNKAGDTFTVVGHFASVMVDMELSVTGEWKDNGKYGWQFEVEKYEEILPVTISGIERYLGSGLIQGCGPVIASRIIDVFGEDTLKVLDKHPDRLSKVPGIGKKRANLIAKSWKELQAMKDIMIFLQGYGVGIATAYRIFQAFGDNSIDAIRENPYQLTSVWGIGFKTADNLAQNIGFDKNSVHRLSSGLEYTLEDSENDGHCFLPKEELKEKAARLLEVEPDELDNIIDLEIENRRVILDEPNNIYLPILYNCEIGVARRIRKILSAKMKRVRADRLLEYAEADSTITYAEAQKDAIQKALTSKITIITGGPGTGKTTTVKGIIKAYSHGNMKILLAAPTGRAAKRLSETTGMEAVTIHRLLEANPANGFGKNEDNQLKGNLLIVDESSMIDILLMYSLLKAVPDDMSIIFIGDVDQLPPVGPGNVLRDIIDSGVVPVVRLTHIFRQSFGSVIVQNAHRINEGQLPYLNNQENSDFFFYNESDSTELANSIVEFCSERLPKYFNINPFEIQVLSPMRRGDCGVVNLNKLLQSKLNPSTISITHGDTVFKLYDKVMQIRNNYEKEVFNGDIGQIVDIDDAGDVSVSFEGLIPVLYSRNELDELVLAYATTVHKSQGSEYDIVVLPVTEQHYIMLQRNLLYTAVTRAKKAIILIGKTKAISIAVRNNRVTRRYTGLKERLLKEE